MYRWSTFWLVANDSDDITAYISVNDIVRCLRHGLSSCAPIGIKLAVLFSLLFDAIVKNFWGFNILPEIDFDVILDILCFVSSVHIAPIETLLLIDYHFLLL